jgi:hypothetical protein
MPGGRYGGGFGWGNGEGQPSVPAMGPIGRIELAIAPQAEKALHVSHREVISDLRTDTESALPEAPQEEVRRVPVEVEIAGWM